MNIFAYTREELATIGETFPQKGEFCPHCKTHIPEFAELSLAQAEKIRQLPPMEQILAVRQATGCDIRWAKIWVHHPNGPNAHKSKNGFFTVLCGWNGKAAKERSEANKNSYAPPSWFSV